MTRFRGEAKRNRSNNGGEEEEDQKMPRPEISPFVVEYFLRPALSLPGNFLNLHLSKIWCLAWHSYAHRNPPIKLVLLDRVLEAKDMALKLRHIHDALQGEVKQKTKRLINTKRGVEERNSQVRASFQIN